ncbi:MAG: diacylglycerol O-acyltransferase / wax synthase [Thermoleophilaceae bacterium]|jgi:diacylglycerol O-acyltransferase|nr:diacylglycerol O-acyltransferase / wax synthase [Thermoleophilaceae bacterium]
MAEDRLTGLDASFLHIESDTSHMHVAGVMLFEGSPPPHADLREALQRKMHLVPRYRQKLAFVPFQQGRPRWVDDPHFNMDYHLRSTALPEPGSEEQLRNLAGRVFAQPLDRDKPLWEMWVVEGLGGGDRFAVLSKTHHALVDGVSGVDIASVLFDVSPDPAPTPEPVKRWLPRPLPSRGQLLAESLFERATVPAEIIRGVRSVFRAPRRIAGAAVGALAGIGAMAWTGMSPAPPSPYNVAIGPHRRFTWVRCSLEDVKAIKNALGGTVNDVMLAIVAGALGRDLSRRGVDVDGLELRAMVPVSVRSDEARGALGNQVAAMMAPLPVGGKDPALRIQKISTSMKKVKESGQALGAQTLTELTGFAPPTIMGQAARLMVRQRFFNLVVTNVPGPQIPLYMMGRRMIEMFPMVPLAPNQALGVAIMSYNGRINFGLVGDFDAMADLEQLAKDFRASLADLAEAAGVELSAPAEASRTARNGSHPGREVGRATVSAASPPAGGPAPPPA